MSTEIAAGIVSILSPVDRLPLGAGFVLTEDGLIVTCAHVIRDAGAGPGDDVYLKFWQENNQDDSTDDGENESVIASVKEEGWCEPELEDVAFLQLKTSLPPGVIVLALGSTDRIENHRFETFGFPEKTPNILGKGEILGKTYLQGIEVIQLQSQQVTPGFSGAPVRDLMTGLVVGMVTSISCVDDFGRGQTTAFATPIEVIQTLLPSSLVTLQVEDRLQVYLRWLLSQHSVLDMPIRQAGRLPQVLLDKVYVALRGDRASSYERSQSQALLESIIDEFEESLGAEALSAEDRQAIRWRILARSPHSPYYEQRERHFSGSEIPGDRITLGEAFQKERQLVILGDPGSGKTTLARWLTQRMAKAFIEGEERLKVLAAQIDPDASSDTEEIDLGPTRLPVLIRVSEYADYRETKELNKEQNHAIVDFLGSQSWLGNFPTYIDSNHENFGQKYPAQLLHELILEYLRRNQTVIILDGLDEITSSNQRDKIIDAIEEFIKIWILQSSTISVQKSLGKKGSVQSDAPSQFGGNQLIVTSRITGYYAAYIKGDLTHVTIEPMSDNAIARFCDAWLREMHFSLANVDDNTPATRRAEVAKTADKEAKSLKTEILGNNRRGVRDLASNPFLITVLAAVHHTTKGRLPEQRAALYRLAIDNLAQLWERRDDNLLQKEDMILKVMAPLAAYIHEKHPTGLITKEDIVSERVSEYLAVYWGKDPEELSSEQKSQAKQFLKTLGEDVGLLAARGKDLYGFLHLTFQEYLAGLSLVQDKQAAAANLLAKVGDPRWREPLLLAIGYAGKWEQDKFQELLIALLQADQSEKLIPRNAFLIVDALSEVEKLPSKVIKSLTEYLTKFYGDRTGLGRFEPLQRQIERAFLKLKRHHQSMEVEKVLISIIKTNRFEGAVTTAVLLQKSQWCTVKIIEALLKALPYDCAEQDWPINTTLADFITQITISQKSAEKKTLIESLQQANWLTTERKAALCKITLEGDVTQPWTAPSRPRMADLRTVVKKLLPFRSTLEMTPALVDFIRGDDRWLRLAIVLYGGTGYFNIASTLNEFIRGCQQFQFGGADAALRREVAIRLDTRVNPKLKRIQEIALSFEPQYIYRDSPLTPHILPFLEKRHLSAEMIEKLWTLWSNSEDVVLQADTIVALAAIGEDVTATLQATLSDTDTQSIGKQALLRLSYLDYALKDSVIRSRKQLSSLFKGSTSSLAPEQQIDAIAASIETLVTAGGEPITTIEIFEDFPIEQQKYLLAEYWSMMLSGMSDDGIYNIAVALDTVGSDVTSPIELLTGALAAAYSARNTLWPLHRGWRLKKLPPLPTSKVETMAEAIDALEQIPAQLEFVRGWALGCFKPLLLSDCSDLMPEVLTLALSTLNDGDMFSPLSDALSKLAPELLEHPAPFKAILKSARDINNPFFKSRALLRLSPNLPGQRDQLINEALSAAREIDSPDQKSRALERLIPVLLKQSIDLRSETLEEAQKISDPDNKIRALCRLAMHFSLDQRVELLGEALLTAEIMAHIKDNQQRSILASIQKLRDSVTNTSSKIEATETIKDTDLSIGEIKLATTLYQIRPYIISYPSLHKRWEGIVSSLNAQWQRDTARNRLAPRLVTYQESLSESTIETKPFWAVLTLSAIARDLQGDAAHFFDLESQWLALAVSEPGTKDAEKILSNLLNSGFEDGLRLTQTAVNTLDILIHREDWPQVESLFPLLHDPDREVIPLIRQWQTQDNIADQATLISAEAEGMNPQSVPCLMRLLDSENDRLRHRAAIVVHGKNQDIRLASELGKETIEALAKEILKNKLLAPRKALTIRWGFERTVFDLPQMIMAWIRNVEGDTAGSDFSALILGGISGVTQATWPVFINVLQHGDQRVQRCILESLVRLQTKQWRQRNRWQLSDEEFEILIAELHRLSQHKSWEVSTLAIEVIGRSSKNASDVTLLMDALQSANARNASAILIALGRIIGRNTTEIQRSILANLGSIANAKDEETASNRHSRLIDLRKQLETYEMWQAYVADFLNDKRPTVSRAAAEALLRSGLTADHLLSISEDKIKTLEALLDACDYLYIGSFYEQAIQNAAIFVEQHPELLEVLLTRLSDRLNVGVVEEDDRSFPLSNLLDVCAAAAKRMPASFANFANELSLQPLLIEALEYHNVFTGRRAAITMLSFLRTITDEIAEALQRALHDVHEVQNKALEATARFSNIDENFLPVLCEGLYHESTVVAYTTGQILKIIGKSEKIEAQQRLMLLSELSCAIDDPRSQRHVYIMGGSGVSERDAFHMRYVGRLDQLLYQVLAQITGIVDIDNSNWITRADAEVVVKQYSVPCNINGEDATTKIYLGDVCEKAQPANYQNSWLSNEQGGQIPETVLNTLDDLKLLALERGWSFSQTLDCAIALSTALAKN
jgi:hypothetical protein